MPDSIILIPNHNYADETPVYVSWLDGIYFVHDPDQNSFKLEETVDGNIVQFTETITDGFVREDSEEAILTITGLEYLEGELVKVTSGSSVVGLFTVADGSITLNSQLTTYQVGKNYESTVIPMDFDIEGTAQSTSKRVSKVYVNLNNTIGGKVGSDPQDLKAIPTGNALFTGFQEVSIPGGYSRDTDIIVKQDEPLPMTLLSITYDISASND
jgi:hypothetical protein